MWTTIRTNSDEERKFFSFESVNDFCLKRIRSIKHGIIPYFGIRKSQSSCDNQR